MATGDKKKQPTVTGTNSEYTEPSTGTVTEVSTEPTTPTETGTETTGELTPTKRRGRPAGAKNKQTTKKDTIGLQEEVAKQYHKAGSKKSFYSEQEAREASDFILTLIQGLAFEFVKEEAYFTSTENTLLNMALPNYLQTINLDTVNKSKSLFYPLAGILGASLYGVRIGKSFIDKRKQEQVDTNPVPYTENNEPSPIDTPEQNYSERREATNDVDWSNTKPKYLNQMRDI